MYQLHMQHTYNRIKVALKTILTSAFLLLQHFQSDSYQMPCRVRMYVYFIGNQVKQSVTLISSTLFTKIIGAATHIISYLYHLVLRHEKFITLKLCVMSIVLNDICMMYACLMLRNLCNLHIKIIYFTQIYTQLSLSLYIYIYILYHRFMSLLSGVGLWSWQIVSVNGIQVKY